MAEKTIEKDVPSTAPHPVRAGDLEGSFVSFQIVEGLWAGKTCYTDDCIFSHWVCDAGEWYRQWSAPWGVFLNDRTLVCRV